MHFEHSFYFVDAADSGENTAVKSTAAVFSTSLGDTGVSRPVPSVTAARPLVSSFVSADRPLMSASVVSSHPAVR